MHNIFPDKFEKVGDIKFLSMTEILNHAARAAAPRMVIASAETVARLGSILKSLDKPETPAKKALRERQEAMFLEDRRKREATISRARLETHSRGVVIICDNCGENMNFTFRDGFARVEPCWCSEISSKDEYETDV